MLNFELNADQVIQRLTRLQRIIELGGGQRILAAGAETVLQPARRVCPVDTGRLRRSGRVEPTQVGRSNQRVSGRGKAIRARFGFDTPYAAVVDQKNYRYRVKFDRRRFQGRRDPSSTRIQGPRNRRGFFTQTLDEVMRTPAMIQAMGTRYLQELRGAFNG